MSAIAELDTVGVDRRGVSQSVVSACDSLGDLAVR